MLDRIAISKQDSDSAFFFDLLLFGEMVTKTITAGLLASIDEEKGRNRYRLAHRLVRADGIGEWSTVIEELCTGAASQYLIQSVRESEQKELTQRVGKETWQYEACEKLFGCLLELAEVNDKFPVKISGKIWFEYFARLRNCTRGHGALKPIDCSKLSVPLFESISLIIQNYNLFKRSWAYLFQNISGKYRVTKLTANTDKFDELKQSTDFASWYRDGIYIDFGQRNYVELITSTPEADDFYYPNGNFRENTFELISYITDNRAQGDGNIYLIPADELAASETQGLGLLEIIGNAFSNLPPIPKMYVERPNLQHELERVLLDKDRYPIVTLTGRGGIGKTSLALSVLHNLSKDSHFSLILWFSARDIDLLMEGPKPVKAAILTEDDVSIEFCRLVEPSGFKTKGFNSKEFLSKQMTKSIYGPILYVFDNFETVKNPVELFNWIDTFIRFPNKVLITSRMSRNFKADYPIEVCGMTETECLELIQLTSKQFNIDHLLNENFKKDIILESSGHPYVIKILLGQVVKDNKLTKPERIIAGQDDILTALFRRTYNTLSPASKRVYLTLCSWRSVIPQIALEAVLLRPENERIDIDRAIEELRTSSFIEIIVSPIDQSNFINVPLAASIFGKSELEVSPFKVQVNADKELLMEFGAAKMTDVPNGLAPRIERKFKMVATKIIKGEPIDNYIPVLEYISSKYTEGWYLIYNLYKEINDLKKAREALKEYLKLDISTNKKMIAWLNIADLCKQIHDSYGEIHALTEMCMIPGIPFYYFSNAADKIFKYIKKSTSPDRIDDDSKDYFIRKLAEMMQERIYKEGDATDFSRLAWLYLHLKDIEKARLLVKQGLEYDEENVYCLKLAERLRKN